ncbi:TRAP transporter permease [Marinobacter koreensis]|uniref:TRAP transporter permease n=1 Tax=Marinobacter koreensis TaxID=335974 RepID=A0ABW0RNG1_9GAMM|nr:TRAP transporter permease [Marinobacter koreensis]MCK7549587.1 TRAP transporter permease [Marinobacter koreensis]
MTNSDPRAGDAVDKQKLEEFLQTESGGRAATGPAAIILFIVPLLWSLFQLWIASPLPYIFNIGVFNSTEARSIHLAFAIFLAFAAFPMFKGKHANHVPIYDWVLALAAAFAASYIFIFYRDLAQRPGAPTTTDMVVAMLGLVLLLEATRRALGLALTIVAAVFIFYSLAGPYMPDVISHGGVSLSKLASHQWLGTEGVFGVALGVSTSFVFLFVLFGAMLEKAGAGSYFIKIAYAMLGHMRGGPAKAAVVSSGLSGVVSGSSIANVVTTGTFTIPLMKRVGFPATKAGAVEVAASVNGQLTPPIMGAAAFLMVEYVGIPYLEVVKAAILPALISYIALLYMVHLEACKLNMKGIERKVKPTMAQRLLSWVTIILGFSILTLVVYYGVGWLKGALGESAPWILTVLLGVIYLALVAYSCKFPDLDEDGPDADINELPPLAETFKAGLYYLLPVVVLVWCLTVERFSPQLSAFWSTVFMMFILVTQKPLKAYFRKSGNVGELLRGGVVELGDALVTGARNMVGIGVATATAGIVVGTVTLTGIGLVMTQFVEYISGGNLLLILIFTAIISLILGMGLPTTANYIVVSTLMAPVIVTLGAENGFLVPLIAVHMFVFYFGILADDTPPVGLAAYAAAAISGADPIRTGVQGFIYDIRTAILPFMFIFNNQLLLLGLTGWFDLLVTVFSAITAMLVFAAATQGYWFTRTRWWEVVLLLLVTFTLFRPGFWWDQVYPAMDQRPATEIFQRIDEVPAGEPIYLRASGTAISGEEVTKVISLNLPKAESPEQRLAQAGLELSRQGDVMAVDFVNFGSVAEKAGISYGWTIDELEIPNDRPPKELMFIPAFLLLGLLAFGQLRRKAREEAEPEPA